MIQEYSKYTEEDHQVWGILFDRQLKNLQDKSCNEYLTSLTELSEVMNDKRVPNFTDVNEVLKSKTGWSIEVVPGLIPVDEFFSLLSDKKFCSSTWLRSKSQLDYLEEPDMFHDTFGHVPLLMNEVYAEFVYRFGKIGFQHINNPDKLVQLQRLYWFTIEFGLFNSNQIYGAGIISSYGETNHVWNDNVEIIPFSIDKVLSQDFKTTEIQPFYFGIDSFNQLYNSLDDAEKILSNS